MRFIAHFFVLAVLLICSCNSQNTKVETKANDAAKIANAIKPAEEVKVGSKTKTITTTSGNGSLYVAPKNASAKKGEEVCVSFTTKHFKDIVSMQYSINWSPKQLAFTKVTDIKLRDLQEKNFGSHVKDQGKLTFSWYDPSIQGITLADDSELYKVCYNAIGEAGSKAKIMFSEDPIIVEITAKNAQFLKFQSKPGYVEIN